MGLYDKILLSIYNVGNAKIWKTPHLFARYGMHLVENFHPRLGYTQSISPQYIHWKESVSLPVTVLIFGLTAYAASKIKENANKREEVKEISPVSKK